MLDTGLRFSTLYGSKWVATYLDGKPYLLRSYCFSTLYGSKWVATCDRCMRTGRRASFSTLYGSKWVATRPCGYNRAKR